MSTWPVAAWCCTTCLTLRSKYIYLGCRSKKPRARRLIYCCREEGEDWVKELEEDIRAEAEKQYGHVVHISVDPHSKGDVYLKFDKVQGGENAIKGLNGRYFGGRMISASPVVDAVYSSLFSRTRAI